MTLWQKITTLFAVNTTNESSAPIGKHHHHRHRWFTVILAAVFGVLLYQVIRPYISLAVITLILAMLFDPLYQRLTKLFGGRHGPAAVLSTGAVFFSIIIPTMIIAIIAAQQAVGFANQLANNVDVQSLSAGILTDKVHSVLSSLPGGETAQRALEAAEFDLPATLTTLGKNAGNFFSTQILNVLKNSTALMTNLILSFFVLMYWFRDKERFFDRLIDLSPLEDDDDRMLLHRFKKMAGQLIKGNFLIALLQGTLGGLIFVMLGIPSAVFWAVMMGFASFIPLGAGIIWMPAVLILLFTGAVGKAVILAIFGSLVIGTVDNIVRAKLLETGEISLPPALTLLSVIGGIQLFGFLGFLYGPLIAVLFLASLGLYRENRKV